MSKQKMKLVVNYQVVYDVDVAAYDTTDPKEMAQIDQSAIDYDPYTTLKHLFDVLPKGVLKFQVTPVEDIEAATGLKVG